MRDLNMSFHPKTWRKVLWNNNCLAISKKMPLCSSAIEQIGIFTQTRIEAAKKRSIDLLKSSCSQINDRVAGVYVENCL